MNHIKRITSNKIDAIVLSRINEFEIIVKDSFRQWYKSTLINIIIIVTILLIGVFHFLFTTDNDILRLVVALAYLFSIAIFIKRRFHDFHLVRTNWPGIKKYTALVIRACRTYPHGERTRAIAYAIYKDSYHEKASRFLKNLHAVASFFHLTPNKIETFEIIYIRMVDFIRGVLAQQIIRYLAFIVLFAFASIIIKNSVILEMRFDNIFETVQYPFKYFSELAGTFIRWTSTIGGA